MSDRPSEIEAVRERIEARIKSLQAAIDEWEALLANGEPRRPRTVPVKFIISTPDAVPRDVLKWLGSNKISIDAVDWHCPRCGFDGKDCAR